MRGGLYTQGHREILSAVAFDQTLRYHKGVHTDICSLADGGNLKHKGTMMGSYLACSRKSKEAGVYES